MTISKSYSSKPGERSAVIDGHKFNEPEKSLTVIFPFQLHGFSGSGGKCSWIGIRPEAMFAHKDTLFGKCPTRPGSHRIRTQRTRESAHNDSHVRRHHRRNRTERPRPSPFSVKYPTYYALKNGNAALCRFRIIPSSCRAHSRQRLHSGKARQNNRNQRTHTVRLLHG